MKYFLLLDTLAEYTTMVVILANFVLRDLIKCVPVLIGVRKFWNLILMVI